MPDFILRANIDHYLELLDKSDLAVETRAMVVKLLIDEEDKLSHYHEQLEFVENHFARRHNRVNRLTNLRNGFADGSDDHKRADLVLENAEARHQLLDQFCHHMRTRVSSRGM
jgi:hypothetical protein